MKKRVYIFCLVLFLFSQRLHSQAIDNLLVKYTQTNNQNEKASLAHQIGLTYQKQNAHQKAVEYFQQAYTIAEPSKQIEILEHQAFSYIQLKNYENAQALYTQILAYQKQHNLKKESLVTLDRLANLSEILKQPYRTLEYAQETFEINRSLGDMIGIAESYNNLGYIYQLIGDRKKSLQSYQKTLEISKLLNELIGDYKRAVFNLNLGTAYTGLEDYNNARYYFEQALKIREKQNNVGKTAEVYNYLAANYYLSGKNNDAIENAEQAIELAQVAQADEVLIVSYKILAEIYQKNDDLKSYQRYNTLYNQAKEKVSQQESRRQENLIQSQLDVEKKENEVKLLLADRERQNLELNQTRLEKEKQAQALDIQTKELALLKSNQERQMIALKNEALERDRTNQLLQITRQKAEAERQTQAINLLEKTRQLQALKDDADKRKRQQEIVLLEKDKNLLEKDKKLQAQKLKDEQDFRNYGIILMVLLAIILTLALIGFFQNRKQNRRLATQNEEIQLQSQEIQAQNEELHQNQEEIMSQRDYIAHKNKELSARDRQITSSINAALTIQQAILPYEKKLNQLLREHFVIFRPKDVVSGDFYWLNEVDGKTFLAVVDCTGHGVPGAFMSLIGNTLLDKIIRVWKILEPADILKRLHEDVQIMLRQKDTFNNNGMDLALIMIEKMPQGHTKITFSGARRPLYYIEAGTSEIKELEGDRKSIGGIQNETKDFVNHIIELAPDSLVYLGSDGYVDQNDVKRKRFTEQKLKATILQIYTLPLSEQKLELEKALENQMKDTQQRDDILLIGLKF